MNYCFKYGLQCRDSKLELFNFTAGVKTRQINPIRLFLKCRLISCTPSGFYEKPRRPYNNQKSNLIKKKKKKKKEKKRKKKWLHH